MTDSLLTEHAKASVRGLNELLRAIPAGDQGCVSNRMMR